MADVAVVGLAATTAWGRGTGPLLAGVLAGRPAFAPVRRFDTAGRRSSLAATLPDAAALDDEIADALGAACRDAGLDAAARSTCPLLLAVHGDPPAPGRDRAGGAAARAERLAAGAGLAAPAGVYTSACVSAVTAVADGAAMIRAGRADRVAIAAGYLVESDQFALFDAGRALTPDGVVRPFSVGRNGTLLGDGVAAVVLESADATRARGGTSRATLAGWGRAGDAYHPCRPRPDGAGMARAVAAALDRAGVDAEQVGYVNAQGSATAASDASEAAALRSGLGDAAGRIPVSATKSTHGHALEASGLIEFVATVLAGEAGRLPVNAGFAGPDEACPLDLVLAPGRAPAAPYALSVTFAFGGANTALLVRVA